MSTIMRKLWFLFLLPSLCWGQTYYNQTDVISTNAIALTNKTFDCNLNTCLNVGGGAITPIYIAKSYGSCTWDATHDVGSCINLAIAAAASASGGTIMLPCGTYGLSTQVLNTTSGVRLEGCGVGIPRDTHTSSAFQASTRLLWIGSSTANPALLVQTAAGGGNTVSAADVWGITVDCNNICGEAIKINGVSFSRFDIGGAEATSINIHFATPTDQEGFGNQYNDIWAYSRSTSASNSPTGIMFDSASGSTFNTSYNRMMDLYAWYNKGDGIVFGDDDNNTVLMIETSTQTPGTSTGLPIVCANGSYSSPNGVAVNGNCRSLRVLHYGGRGFDVQGSQTGSVLTANGGNTGTAALHNGSFTVSTNAAQGSQTLLTNSTTGINANEAINCGGVANGFISNNPINQIVTNTSISFVGSFAYTVPSSTVCTATYGITSQAAVGPGTYTITATSSTQYSIAYAGTGSGHAQTGITVSGGFLIFTDIVLPWTGTPVTNDSWTVTLPLTTRYVDISGQDKGNNAPTPTFEYGASGTWWPQGQALPWAWNEPCNYYAIGTAASQNAQINNTVSGEGSCALGGTANNVSGNFSSAYGGTNNTVQANGAAAFGGQNNSLGGIYSASVGGFNINDRSRYGANCYASGKLVSQGDAQTCYTVLRGTGSSGSAIQISSDNGVTTAADCVNIPDNTAYALNMDIVAFDHTTPTKFAGWIGTSGLLTRGTGAASTAVALISATPQVSYSGGTLTGNSMSITADTTNGCLNISWTPPTSNTDTWNVVATVRTTEVQ